MRNKRILRVRLWGVVLPFVYNRTKETEGNTQNKETADETDENLKLLENLRNHCILAKHKKSRASK